MDEVLEKLQGLGGGTPKTEFEDLYKNWGRLGNQEERRQEILQVQRCNRYEKIDEFRGILQLVQAVEDACYEPQNWVRYRPSIYVAGFHKASPTYRNVLMLSEWLIEKPEDFNENWYVVPCPKGVRMIVVANKGSTKCYSKFGQFRFETRTALPGGNPCESKQSPCCVLDCFYDEKINTMFVLDLLAWNNQPMTDGECEFRHYWLTTQFQEKPALKTINKKNKLVFKLLPKIPCMKDSLNEFMSKYPPFEDHYPLIDGLLFFHKKAHYVSGETPLVGWLYPYMVNEVLGEDITVNSAYLLGKPTDYENQVDFIRKFEAKMAKKSRSNRCRRSSTSSTMSVTDDENHNAMDTDATKMAKRDKKDKQEKERAKTVTETSDNAEEDTKEAVPAVMEISKNAENCIIPVTYDENHSSMDTDATDPVQKGKKDKQEKKRADTVTGICDNAEKDTKEAEPAVMEICKNAENRTITGDENHNEMDTDVTKLGEKGKKNKQEERAETVTETADNAEEEADSVVM